MEDMGPVTCVRRKNRDSSFVSKRLCHAHLFEKTAIIIHFPQVNIYSGQSTEDIEREARIMGSLKHENVVPFYGATIDYMCDGALHNEQRCCCLFMKYLSGFYDFYIYLNSYIQHSTLTGGTLASCGRIGNTPLYNYTQQTLNGIEYCHRRGITHGDIKCK